MRVSAPRGMKMGVGCGILCLPQICAEVDSALVQEARRRVCPEPLCSTTNCRPRLGSTRERIVSLQRLSRL